MSWGCHSLFGCQQERVWVLFPLGEDEGSSCRHSFPLAMGPLSNQVQQDLLEHLQIGWQGRYSDSGGR